MNISNQDLKDTLAVIGEKNCQKLSGKTVLLTGGSGFLGTLKTLFFIFLNREVLQQPIKLISVDNYLGRDNINKIEDENITYINHDLTQRISNITKVDYIISCMGSGSPVVYKKFPLETIDTAVNGTRHLLELALESKATILNFSSSEVVSWPKVIPTPETEIPCAASLSERACYDQSKVLGTETLPYIYRTRFGVDAKTVRLFNCCGPFYRNDHRVIPNLITKTASGKDIEYFSPGTQTRTYSYFSDVVAGCLLVLLNGKQQLYNIGNSNNEISIKDLAYKIAKLGNAVDRVKMVDAPDVYKTEPQRRCPDISLAQSDLGYFPRINLDEMLSRIYQWYLFDSQQKTS